MLIVKYAYKICSLYPGSEEALKILSEKYYTESLPNKLTILESILNFNQTIPAVRDILLSAISSDQAPLISVASDGMDSSFVNSHKDTLSDIIRAQVSAHLNDADFIESLMSLEDAAAKIPAELKDEVINSLSASNLYSVRKFIAGLKGQSIHSISKPLDDFNNYWENAFKYSEAEIVTDKGSFTRPTS